MNRGIIHKHIARKYARAFMAVFPQAVTFSSLAKIEVAQRFLQTHKRTLFFLQLPQFDQDRRQSMVADLIDYFALPHDLTAIMLLLIEHNRSFYIPAVFMWIMQLYKEQINSIEFSITTTHTLDTQEIEVIKKFLSYVTHKKIIGKPLIDTSLIAGLRLQSNDYLWEYSIRKQIKALQALKR